jgi:hypothetical protein
LQQDRRSDYRAVVDRRGRLADDPAIACHHFERFQLTWPTGLRLQLRISAGLRQTSNLYRRIAARSRTRITHGPDRHALLNLVAVLATHI